MEIENRIAMITGAKRIGSEVALELASAGASVALTYKSSRSEAEQAVTSIIQSGGRAMALQADVSCQSEVESAVAQVNQEWGSVDVLINMASIYALVPFDELTESVWDANMDSNLKGAFLCSMAVVSGMRQKRGGRIINFADWIAASGRPRYHGYLPYYVSKLGIIGLTQALALELASDNILVNAIAPGPILPPSNTTAEVRREVEKATPLGRWGGSREIVKAVRSLIETDFITGECVRVDGGRHLF
jgi:3-oxoacyl-[acyl-carrier protein] reductase